MSRVTCSLWSHLGTDGEPPGGAVGQDAGHLPGVPGPEHAAAGPPHRAQPILVILGHPVIRGQHPPWVRVNVAIDVQGVLENTLV